MPLVLNHNYHYRSDIPVISASHVKLRIIVLMLVSATLHLSSTVLLKLSYMSDHLVQFGVNMHSYKL